MVPGYSISSSPRRLSHRNNFCTCTNRAKVWMCNAGRPMIRIQSRNLYY